MYFIGFPSALAFQCVAAVREQFIMSLLVVLWHNMFDRDDLVYSFRRDS